MKQLALNDDLKAKIKASNPDIDPSKITLFAAAALSTAPIRQRHAVFFNAVHTESYLEQMKEMLAAESRPVQIMHGSSDGDQLPVGRVFHGDISQGTGVDGATELVTLFWVDNTHPELIEKINSGTIDQVSVSVLAKKALSNKTGFDFLGPKVSGENIYGGLDDKGNKMGVDGAHVLIPEIDQWFEMSLVGQGGAQGAKILGSGRLQLAISHQEVPPLTLTLSTGSAPPKTDPAPKKDTFDMDAKDFAALLDERATKLANAETAKLAAETALATKTTELAALQTELAALKASSTAEQVTALTAEKTELTSKLAAQVALTSKLVAPLFTQLGNPAFTLPAVEADALKAVTDAVDGVKALGARLSGGMNQGGQQMAARPNNAFKRAG